MSFKKTAIALVVVLIGLAAVLFFEVPQSGQDQPPASPPEVIESPEDGTLPLVSDDKFYPIHELREGKLGPGSYNTEGYVVYKSFCPPCPEGAMCKPCPPQSIVISEQNTLIEGNSFFVDRTEKNIDMILNVNYADQFELGKKYKFSINILEIGSTDEEPVVELIE